MFYESGMGTAERGEEGSQSGEKGMGAGQGEEV